MQFQIIYFHIIKTLSYLFHIYHADIFEFLLLKDKCQFKSIDLQQYHILLFRLSVIGSSKSEIYDIYGEDSEQIIFQNPQNILFN